MAVMLSIAKLRQLLDAIPDSVGMSVFMDNAAGLKVGRTLDSPDFRIDFATEAVLPLEVREVSVVSPQSLYPPSTPHRRTGEYAVEFGGARYVADSGKALLVVGLQALENAHPGTLEKLSHAKNRSRRIVSRDRGALFDKKHLVEKNSIQIADGWWVGTNNSHQQIKNWLLKAAQCAGVTDMRIQGLEPSIEELFSGVD